MSETDRNLVASRRLHTVERVTRRGFLGASALAVTLPALASQPAAEPATELQRVKSMLAGPEPVTWLFTGDSITHGALHTFGYRSYPEHFAERVRFEMNRKRDIVINTGISGDTIGGLANDLEHRVLRFRPQVVSIMMGMNDSAAGPDGRERYRSGYEELLGRIRRETQAAIIIHTCNPITAADKVRQDLPAYVAIIREVAARHKTILVDQDQQWRARQTTLEYLLSDGSIHPNQYGHVLMAHLLCQQLGIHDPTSAVGRLFVP